MNFMRGVGCITPGALEIEGKKKASELISEVTKEGFDFSTTNKSLPDVFLLDWAGKVTHWIMPHSLPLRLIIPLVSQLQMSEPDGILGFANFANFFCNFFLLCFRPRRYLFYVIYLGI